MRAMKILTIGIDGGDEKIIKAMPMPNLHKILDQNVCLDIEEDLWSRGWVEILSGVHGRESGAFYVKPLLDNTYTTTQKFSIADYAANSTIKPLWKKLAEDGHKVGFMNVPSMMPAPEVNGFAVSGGGAGASTSGAVSIPPEGCFPNSVKEQLEHCGYILDTRFVASGLRDVEAYFKRIIEMTQQRTKSFIGLCNQYQAAFGFIAFMGTNRIQNVFMSEIEELTNNTCTPTNLFQEKIVDFYKKFDECIGKLISELSPKNVMIVSDHGQSPRLYTINLNPWLQKQGFQYPLSQSANGFKRVAKFLASFLPKGIKQCIRSSAPKISGKLTGLSADWKNTKAFSVNYVPGIYLNDNKRFSGIIHSEEERQELIKNITVRFNQDPENQRHGLTARPYRIEYKGSNYESLLPDVWIDHSDAYFFEQHGKFIEKNMNYGPITSLAKVDHDLYTGIKGRRPLLCVDTALANLVKADDDSNLTLAYKLIIRGMDL